MKKQLVLYSTLVLSTACLAQPSSSEQLMLQIQRSHVEGNVPPAEQFDAVLRRDLASYFKSQSISYELLREGPTQSGVSYPKYYLWVRASLPNETVAGAVRVAAIDKTRFEVFDFISSKQIQADPSQVQQVFPALLVPSILAKAGVK